ncbi:MAG: hypothetical protein L0Y71_06260 [Gemmataceae bacterium]|nr:hypothetical protein [Gemmataceae bacterium]
MSTVTVSEQAVSDLASLTEATEIRDSTGKLIGVFRPATEIERRCNQSGLHTTLEVFQHMRALTNDPERLADLDRHIGEIKRRDQDPCPTH